MANNPRKFIEKIALHNQKQLEETAEFEKIMREVSAATRSETSQQNNQHLRINPSLGSFHGGSLPNVNHVAHKKTSSTVDLKAALNNLEEMQGGGVTGPAYRERGRSMGVGVGPMRASRPAERRTDTSPYSSGPFLSPPSQDGWRRTNSDSALHQSTQMNDAHSHHSPGSQRRATDGQQYEISRHNRHLSVSPDGRPRSCYDVARVPGINIYPSQQDPGIVQIPIGNNTGSLPDLTSFHFPSPLPTPLDQDDQHSGSTYSNSPQGTSTSTLSPTSIPTRVPGRFSFQSSPPHESPGPPQYSPVSPQSPLTPQSITMDGSLDSKAPNNYGQASPGQGQQGGGGQAPNQGQGNPQQFVYPQIPSPQHSQQQSQCSVSVSPLNISNPQNIPVNPGNSLGSYRNAQCRSPQNSPGPCLTVKYGRDSNSPTSSNPQSPASPSNSIAASPFSTSGSYFISQDQTNALQQTFQQFTVQGVDWSQLLHTLVEANPSEWISQLQMDSPVSNTVDYIGSPNNASYHLNDDGCSGELSADPGYFSTSPTHYNRQMNSSHTTPNTPSSIPDIVLTDFSNGDGDIQRSDFGKEIICNAFENDLFSSVESMREGLDPIDLDGLQLLTDPNMMPADPATEDHFRLDRM
nr:PREDICTED: CREB-regulated transcription coactivator 1-like isoform X3 [Bemisia tabaci]